MRRLKRNWQGNDWQGNKSRKCLFPIPLPRIPLPIFWAFLFCLAVVFPFPTRAEEKSTWSRIVVIGASVSHGFTFAEPFDGPKTREYALHRYLDAAILAPHEQVRNLASAMFFMVPDDMGHTQIREALTNHPTLVIAIDFPFWFCYGVGATDHERAEHLEKGLKMLEAVECPLIIGDIPDASAARNRALRPSEFPSAKARAAANLRLKEWTAQHKQVTLVPTAEFMRTVVANEELTVHGHVFAAGTTRALLQGDRLHPSQRGCAALAVSILDVFLAAHPNLKPAEVCWDADEVLKAVESKR